MSLSNPAPDDGDRVYVTFVDGVATASLGTVPAPDSTIQMSAANYLGMLNGTWDVAKGYMTGQFKVLGNAMVVNKLRLALVR